MSSELCGVLQKEILIQCAIGTRSVVAIKASSPQIRQASVYVNVVFGLVQLQGNIAKTKTCASLLLFAKSKFSVMALFHYGRIHVTQYHT